MRTLVMSELCCARAEKERVGTHGTYRKDLTEEERRVVSRFELSGQASRPPANQNETSPILLVCPFGGGTLLRRGAPTLVRSRHPSREERHAPPHRAGR